MKKRVQCDKILLDLAYALDGKSLEECESYFAMLYNKHEQEMINEGKSFTIIRDWDRYDGGMEFYLIAMRDETDKEYAARLAKEQAVKDKAAKAKATKKAKALAAALQTEQEEREMYERLRSKFEQAGSDDR